MLHIQKDMDNTLNERLERIEASVRSLLVGHKQVLNIQEASEYLGISTSHLYKHTSNNNIPFFRPQGKRIYFKRSELDEWLLRNRNSSNFELELKVINQIPNKGKLLQL
ncbi:MAG: binding domain protein excisionase family [Chitinophagaceae bacterium]|nr:binding domain protein excisionase family [Chitinophagaceae bacterium]